MHMVFALTQGLVLDDIGCLCTCVCVVRVCCVCVFVCVARALSVVGYELGLSR